MVKKIKVKLEKIFGRTNPRHNRYVWIMLVLLTLPHLNPGYLNQIYAADFAINCCRVISSVLILGWMLFIRRRISPIAVLIGIQQGYLLFITLVSHGAVRDGIIIVSSILSVVLLYDLAHDEGKFFLSSQLFCFEIVIYINLITEILFPDTLYLPQITARSLDVHNSDYWFLGFRNVHSQYYIPALMIAFLYKLETKNRIRTYVLTAAVFISAILAWSGGVLVALFGMAGIYILFRNRIKIFHYFSYWIIHILFFVFVILLKMQNLFKWLIDGILGKWRSMEVRMSLWDTYLKEYIPKKFICGYGIELSITRQQKVNINWAGTAHNQLLEIMYQGGIINLLLFAAIIIIAGKNVYRYRNTEESKIISIAFLGWSLHGLVDSFMTPFLMGMFVIAYHSNVKNGAFVPEGTFMYWKNVFKNVSGRIKSKARPDRDELNY